MIMNIMDRDVVVKSAVLLAFLLVSASERIEDDVAKEPTERHIFMQRSNPLQDCQKVVQDRARISVSVQRRSKCP